MSIEEDIKQRKFITPYHKAIINILYTSSWVNEKQSIIFKPFGITAAQYNVLRILRGQYPNPSTINMIIERMLDRMSNASRIVDKLERKELVVRKPCRSDRRAVDVFISDKGQKLLAELDVHIEHWVNNLQVLTKEEAENLNILLDKLRTAHFPS